MVCGGGRRLPLEEDENIMFVVWVQFGLLVSRLRLGFHLGKSTKPVQMLGYETNI